MGRSDQEYQYVYMNDSTGTCYAPIAETADPNALASRMRNYVVLFAGPESGNPSAGRDLVAQMVRDQGFVRQVDEGWADVEHGRVASVGAVKRRLGDL